MSRKNAIKPLSDRLNDYQRGRRATRIMARRTVIWWMLRGLPRPTRAKASQPRRPKEA